MQEPNPHNHFRRRWLGLVVSLLVLGVLLWDWNWLRSLAEWKATASLGRKVSIGHLDVSLSRYPLIVLDQVVIANPSEFPTGSAFTTIAKLAIRVDPWKDFGGPLNLPEVTIDAPLAYLLLGPSGQPNYRFEALLAKMGQPGPVIEIGQIRIADGDVHFVDAKLKSDFHLKVRTIDAPDGGKPSLHVDAEGTYAGQPVTGRFIGGAVLSLRDPTQPYPVDLLVKHGATVVTLRGTVERPMEFGGAQLKLDLRGDNLADLYLLTGMPLPSTSAYKLSGDLAYAEHNVLFKHFSGTVGESDLSGDIAMDLFAKPRKKITANLKSKRMVMKDLGGAIGATPGQAGAKTETLAQKNERAEHNAGGKMLPDVPINLPRIRAADLDAHLTATRLESESTPLDNLDAHIIIADGQLSLVPVSFGVGNGGSIKADIVLDGQQDPAHISANVDFRKLDLSHMLNKMTAFQGVGRIGGTAHLVSTGNSLADMLGRGDGEIKLFMAGGDISALLVDLVGLDFGNSLLSALGIPRRRAELRCMLADFGLERGQLITRTMLVDTTEANIIGSGSVNLRDEQIDYKLKTQPKHMNIGSVAAPILIKGNLKTPVIGPAPGALTVRAASAVVLGALLTPLGALIPTIQLGLGEDNDCVALLKSVGASPSK